MKSGNELTEKFYRLFRENLPVIESVSSPLLNTFRGEAMERFLKSGIPVRKNEPYRYTPMEAYFEYDYHNYYVPVSANFERIRNFKCDVEDLDCHTILLHNGYFPESGVKLDSLPDNIWFGSINEAAEKFRPLMESHLGKYCSRVDDGLVHLNTALSPGGIFIHVPEGTMVEKPVQIINLIESDQDVFNQRKNLIVIEPGSVFTIIICDHTLSLNRFLTNTVTEVYVGENAHFNIIRIQNEHNNSFKITSTFIHQENNSSVSSNNITLHGGLVRNNTFLFLSGQDAQCTSYGLYLADKMQHIDNYVNVEHLAPGCTSNQLFKGILDEKSKGVFNGRIYVARGAQDTSAYQKNNSILLTNDARMYTKPHLEIFADEVKCSHGATVGQLDNDAMFYLQSRGINRDEARLMLMTAFADEVIQKISIEPLKHRIRELVIKRLRGEVIRCTFCAVKCN